MNGLKIIAAASLTSGIIGFATIPLLTYLHSADKIGDLVFFQMVLTIGANIAAVGSTSFLIRNYYEWGEGAALAPIIAVVATTLSIIAIIASALQLSPEVLEIQGRVPSPALLITGILSLIVVDISASLTRLRQHKHAYIVILLLPKVLFLSAAIILPKASHGKISALDSVYGITITASAAISFLIVSQIRKPNYEVINFHRICEMMRYGFPIMLGTLLLLLVGSIDRIILSLHLDRLNFGHYATAAAIANGVNLLGSILASTWIPSAYKMHAEGKLLERLPILANCVSVAFPAVWATANILSILLFAALPEDYNHARHFAALLISGQLLIVLVEVTGIGVFLQRRTWRALGVIAIVAAFSIPQAYFLIAQWGAMGAALSTMLSFLLYWALRTETSSYRYHAPIYRRVYLNIVVLLCLTAAMAFLQVTTASGLLLWLLYLGIHLTLQRKTLPQIFSLYKELQVRH